MARRADIIVRKTGVFASVLCLGFTATGCASFKASDKDLYPTAGREAVIIDQGTIHIGDLPHSMSEVALSGSGTLQANPNQGIAASESRLGTDIILPATLTQNQVLQLQQGLIAHGFNPDRMSGVYGPQTNDALGAFMAFNYPGLPLQRRVLEMLGVTF